MDQWYSKDLGDGVAAHEPSIQIQKAFLSIALSRNGNTKGIAVFSRYDLRTNVVTVYFTPGATELAKMFSATQCAKPLNDDRLGLLVGDSDAKEVAGLL